jgi:peptidyl-prolyl cis-trans isomerase SurA
VSKEIQRQRKSAAVGDVSRLDYQASVHTVSGLCPQPAVSLRLPFMHRPFVRLFASAIAAVAAIALVFHSPQIARAQEVLDGIAAVVNSDVITYSQMRDLVGEKEKVVRNQLKGEELVNKIKEIRLAAINDLIDRQLILQEFKTKGYQIPDYFVDQRVTTIIREEFGGDRQAFLRTLQAQGYTLDRFKQLEKDKIIVQEMRRSAIKGAININENQIEDYYKEHAEQYSTPEQVKLRMLVIRGSGDNAGPGKMIEEIREKIVSGAEFGDLAKMYSQGSEQESGGDWGWVDRKKLNEDLTKVAFSLKPGQVSKVIEIGGSYYLLFVEAKKAATFKPLKDLHDEIEKTLMQTERQRLQEAWIKKLRKPAYIKIY